MKNNKVETVMQTIAATQDGKNLKDDRFSNFIKACIEKNTYSHLFSVNVEDLDSDFQYMIDQLTKARKPLKEWIANHPEIFTIPL